MTLLPKLAAAFSRCAVQLLRSIHRADHVAGFFTGPVTRIGLLLATLAQPVTAQETPAPAPVPGRFLFLVDTSFSMRGRVDGTLKALESLLASDLDGRLKPGDTIGLWTFNETVYAGRFPLQTWSPATRSAITESAIKFLRSQRHEKKTDLDQALARTLPIVRDSRALTLILISDGDEPLRGTPFDQAVNATFRKLRGVQSRARMPIVTVLRAERGQFTAHVVGQPPWPVAIPLTPGEQEAIEAAKNRPPKLASSAKPATTNLTAAAKPTVPAVAPKKPAAPKPEPKPQPKPEPAKPAEVAPAAQTPVTPPPKSPEAKPIPAPVAQPNLALPPEASPSASATSAQPSAEPAPKPVEKPVTPVAVTVVQTNTPPLQPEIKPSASPVEPTPVAALASPPIAPPAVEVPKPTPATTPLPVATKPAETQQPQPGSVVAEAKPAVAEPATKPQAAIAATSTVPQFAAAATKPLVGIEPRPLENVQPSAAPTPAAKAIPAEPPVNVVAPSPPPPPAPLPVVTQTLPALKPLPVESALVTPPPFLSGYRLLAAGLFLLAVAVGLFVAIVRRTRAAATHPSLITQSFDRDRKQP